MKLSMRESPVSLDNVGAVVREEGRGSRKALRSGKGGLLDLLDSDLI